MNRLVSLPLIFRQIQAKQCNIHSSKRNLSYTTRILTQNLTSNSHSEFHKRKASDISVQNRLITNSIVTDNFKWRSYSTNKPPSNQSSGSAAATGGDDSNVHDDELDWDDETDDETDGETKTVYESVPSINTVPDFFPKVPMIATAYPVFPKFMKVFEVCIFLLFLETEHFNCDNVFS